MDPIKEYNYRAQQRLLTGDLIVFVICFIVATTLLVKDFWRLLSSLF